MRDQSDLNLTNLPPDLFTEIAKHLHLGEIQKWRASSRFFHGQNKLYEVLLKKLEEASTIKKVAIGGKDGKSCLLLRGDGRVYTVQRSNLPGKESETYLEPGRTSIRDTIIDIAISNTVSYFLKKDGTVLVFGNGKFGELGCGENTAAPVTTQFKDLSNVIQIAAGSEHILFLKNDGSVWGCGHNDCGQLGLDDQINRFTPVQIPNLKNIKTIATGNSHSFFIDSKGMGFACGSNHFGELGIESFYDELRASSVDRNFLKPQAIKISNGEKIKQISINGKHCPTTCILTESGNVFFCGYPFTGLANEFDHVYTAPQWVASLKQIKQIAIGNYHALFVQKDGSVLGCGFNYSKALGLGDCDEISKLEFLPVKQIQSAFANANSSFFITENRELYICGWVSAFKATSNLSLTTCFDVPSPMVNLNRDIDQIIATINTYLKLQQPTDKTTETERKFSRGLFDYCSPQ